MPNAREQQQQQNESEAASVNDQQEEQASSLSSNERGGAPQQQSVTSNGDEEGADANGDVEMANANDDHEAQAAADDVEPFFGFDDNEVNPPEAPAAAAAAAAEDRDPFYGFDGSESFESNDMTKMLQIWELRHTQTGFDPVPVLRRLAEIFEKEMSIYMRKDPDPFDERHPYRTDPKCHFGVLLKVLFRKEHFMNKLVNDYLRDNYFTRQNIQKSSLELNILACRLILVIMPGLETSAVFQGEFDNLINRIYAWAEDSIEPLQSYATGLVAAAMEVSEIAVTFRELNARLVPKMIKRLHMLQAIYKSVNDLTSISASSNNDATMMRATTSSPSTNQSASPTMKINRIIPIWMTNSAPQSPEPIDASEACIDEAHASHNGTLDSFANNSNVSTIPENSRDAGGGGGVSGHAPNKHYYRKMYIPIHPATAETSQMLIMRYLTSMGEYQEYLGVVFEHNVMQLIFGYIERLDRRDTCLAFEALKYLASLLCHKKFALEFISHGGLELLLKVPRPSIAATGVSITLYYLAYSEDAMERICTMPKPIITDLVRYALWILGRSYDSGKCHATMFFGLSFQFKVILDEFDAQDGLRKLYNVISILKILNPSNNDEEELDINEDVELASRQLVRHVCVALKRYMESHLFYKFNNFMRQQCPTSSEYAQNVTKAAKTNLEQISDQIRTLQENTSMRIGHWAPVDQLLKLGGITLLLKIIAFSYDWNHGGRSETVRSALDVLSICCVVPRVYSTYCDRLELPDMTTTGICSILGAAAGDITTDADVQKSALAVLCHCVCMPLTRREPNNLMKCFGSSKKMKQTNKYAEDIIEKVWESVCSSNGIIVLLSLMQIKGPITDADCIRGMACRALAGLARSDRVRQIVGKLPLFASGQIQTLMRDPILQEKRSEHVIFQKYALELLERVSGRAKPMPGQIDPSLANIHKANVVAQTKIQYNEQQLYQLIHDHLESKGLTQSANMLAKETGLQLPATSTKSFHQSPFDYKVLPTSSLAHSMARNRMRARMQDVYQTINGTASPAEQQPQQQSQLNSSFSEEYSPLFTSPIKLVRKSEKTATNNSPLSANSGSSSSHNCINNAINPNNNSGSTIGSNSGGGSGSNSQTQRSLQKKISLLPDEGTIDEGTPNIQNNTGITLSTIVTEYLTNQHALCNNPMTTCPQFDLFTPHKCPDPKPNRMLGTNINLTARLFRAQSGYNTSRLDRRFVHSNFAPWRTIRSNDYNEIEFSCCAIVPTSNMLIVGTHLGEAKAINMNDGVEQFSFYCHSYLIDTIQTNRRGDLVLTSCSWRSPLSALWSIRDNEFVSKMRFNDEFHCEFSNLSQDKVLGTQNDCAVIYDINTCNKISTFSPVLANQYTKNRATFCPTDELILSDGVLYDVRCAREIHKFDKLNQSLSGVFHPNGLEIISNTEVWDLRTFHLLQTVPVLDQCLIRFSPQHVMYGINLDVENRNEFDDTPNYDTSFKVLDSYDYTSIATIDVKRNICDLSVNGNGSLIALVENQPAYDSKQETFVKIYAVGMKKNEQQEEEDDEEEPDSDDEHSDSDATDDFDLNNRFPEEGEDEVVAPESDDDDDDSDISDFDLELGNTSQSDSSSDTIFFP